MLVNTCLVAADRCQKFHFVDTPQKIMYVTVPCNPPLLTLGLRLVREGDGVLLKKKLSDR